MDSRRWLYLGSATTFAILPLFLVVVLSQETEKYNFGPFNHSMINRELYVIPMAWLNFSDLQLSPYSADGALRVNSGRVFINKPFKLWDDTRIASFNTSFLMNIYRVRNNTPGEGIAFIIGPSLSIPPLSYGNYLGLTNQLTDGNSSNQIVAVEFDTVKQDFDPDDNHVGLDINGVVSKVTVPLSKFGWLQYHYDGPIVAEKPSKAVLSSHLDLKGLVNDMSYFGFSASTGNYYELNAIFRWNLSVEVLPNYSMSSARNDNYWWKTGVGVGVGAPLLALLITGVMHFLRRKIRESGSDPKLLSTLKRLPGTPSEFRFRELKIATNNFHDSNKLGQGGFGIVYRGTLPKEKLQMAVKKFSRDSIKGISDFLAELTIINCLRYKNLVRLLGWCHKNGILLLVYEYMPNGSLDHHLFFKEGTNKTPLSWHLRYKIISGLVAALNYLHNECDKKVIHRDLKASNIMLDSDFNARLGDFGLARAIENKKTSYANLHGVPGTMGYIAPECLYIGKATRESDVYGFGAVLLEVVCGQRPWTKNLDYQFLVDWVWHLHRQGRILEAVDPRLENEFEAEEAERVLKLGLACSHPIASERPKMQTIVQIISGSVPVPYVPPFKPPFVWPAADQSGASSGDPSSSEPTAATLEYSPINTTFFAR
ncbi:hypothetical protein AHAS_Ahas15G0026000 [Arachis hypogaea]